MEYCFQRSVPKIIKYPKLVPLFGSFTPQVSNRNRRYVYFVRQTQEGIPLHETERISKLKMPAYVLVGCTSGRVLMSLGLQLEVFASHLLVFAFLRHD